MLVPLICTSIWCPSKHEALINVVVSLVRGLGRWPNNETTSGESVIFTDVAIANGHVLGQKVSVRVLPESKAQDTAQMVV